MSRLYHVYIVSNRSRCLYVGSTSELKQRIWKHRTRHYPRSHTAQYRIDRLVYYEQAADARAMVRRERELKGWTRSRKIALIERVNPGWDDLASGWFER